MSARRLAVLILLVALLAVSACGSSKLASIADEPRTAGTTIAAAGAASSSSETAAPDPTTSTPTSTSSSSAAPACGVDLDAAQVRHAMSNLDLMFDWKAEDGNYDPCARFSWASAVPENAAGRDYPTAVLLFVKGISARAAAKCAVPSEVTDSNANSVTVAYPITPEQRDMKVNVTYTLTDAGSITQDGDVPKPLLEAAGC
ncbi:LppP/LprE family lipoprotein [Gordonia sp. MP11Mi]|uniref:LppP/LprE family lipoprotein n=1 Tax=Gordonia sp. MP11Mi TaxID=3022769 RepID=A0AA97CRA5_9ACTN